jgi:EAL domain-containing protein (putative c-di-GMP-specific phosphodiesterase class I)/GGDEF domain-containing protein
MFHWLSKYNYDFALAAIPIQLILLLFYCSRKNLPVHSSRSFLWVMIANLVMTAADLIACEMNEVWTSLPLWSVYLANQAFFLGFILRGWALFDYTAAECHAYGTFGKSVTWLLHIPAIAIALLTLSTPWTATIFQFVPGKGYSSCYAYPLIYCGSYFYIAASLLCVFVRWGHIDTRLKVSMLSYNAILIAGILLRKQFESSVIVMSYFSILAILFIYLSAQNPDLYRDKKTHLFNRDAFDKIGREYLYHGTPFQSIAANVYNYASTKTLYGQQQIDRCMETFGNWMRRTYPNFNVFYFGQGEFLLLSIGQAAADTGRLVASLRTHFEHTWTSGESEIPLAVSAMVLPYELFPREITRAGDFISYIFGRTYIENRKGNYLVSGDLAREFDREKAVENALSLALSEKRIQAYYQPIYSVREGRIVAAEALARLNDERLGFIPPDEFIRVAERTGDIMEVGRQIVSRVCEFLIAEHPEKWGVNRVSVNLSPAQCMNDQLAAEMADIIKAYGVPFSRINFEITESSIEDHFLIRKQMLSLQERGADFSLDDFGSGTSNIVRLLDLPIHTVKLDKNLVDSYFNSDSSILPDLVSMFRNARMHIVAEGVETREMLGRLAAMGCNFIQGFYFSRPVPSGEFMSYLRSDHAARIASELKDLMLSARKLRQV